MEFVIARKNQECSQFLQYSTRPCCSHVLDFDTISTIVTCVSSLWGCHCDIEKEALDYDEKTFMVARTLWVRAMGIVRVLIATGIVLG